MLDDYRRSFSEAFGNVMSVIRDELKLEPTGRPAKSTASIVDKLRRESIRLSQIQDIAGCRLIVADIREQDSVVSALAQSLPDTTVVDRREKPSHGYRAVHLIVGGYNRLVEVQVRTEIQQLWAELSEKLSDVVDPSLKYGGGDSKVQQVLTQLSNVVDGLEDLERRLAELPSDESIREKVDQLHAKVQSWRTTLRASVQSLITVLKRTEKR